jgi:rhodanese-related sulfurtransferase
MSDEEIEVEVLDRLRAEGRRVVVVDVRSAEEFAAGHVAGALHVPGAELAAHADELRGAELVVTVCGKGGGRSAEGAALLRSLGVRARLLGGGTFAWLAAHLADRSAPPSRPQPG